MTRLRQFTRPALIFLVMSLAAVVAACGGDAADEAGIRVVSVDTAAEILEQPPEDLVVLDVRTPEEFNEGHLEGAVMIDFYAPDFAAKLAELDPDKSYVLYCRSGNRSGSARVVMETLGFTDVADVEGGINAWNAAGQPTALP